MQADGTINDYAWNFMAITFDDSTKILRLWKNGFVVFDVFVGGNFAWETNKQFISLGYTSKYFKGKLSCISLYDKKLTAEQIHKLIHNCRGKADLFSGNKNFAF